MNQKTIMQLAELSARNADIIIHLQQGIKGLKLMPLTAKASRAEKLIEGVIHSLEYPYKNKNWK